MTPCPPSVESIFVTPSAQSNTFTWSPSPRRLPSQRRVVHHHSGAPDAQCVRGTACRLPSNRITHPIAQKKRTESLKVRHSERTSMACASTTSPHSYRTAQGKHGCMGESWMQHAPHGCLCGKRRPQQMLVSPPSSNKPRAVQQCRAILLVPAVPRPPKAAPQCGGAAMWRLANVAAPCR